MASTVGHTGLHRSDSTHSHAKEGSRFFIPSPNSVLHQQQQQVDRRTSILSLARSIGSRTHAHASQSNMDLVQPMAADHHTLPLSVTRQLAFGIRTPEDEENGVTVALRRRFTTPCMAKLASIVLVFLCVIGVVWLRQAQSDMDERLMQSWLQKNKVNLRKTSSSGTPLKLEDTDFVRTIFYSFMAASNTSFSNM